MTQPARQLAEPVAQPAPVAASMPARRPAPARRPVSSPRPAERRGTSAPLRSPRPADRHGAAARRRGHLGFVGFAGTVVTVLVVGVVTLNAFLAQSAYHMREAEERLAELRTTNVQLTEEVARRSSPVKVASWARQHRMVMPAVGDVHVLRVRGSAR